MYFCVITEKELWNDRKVSKPFNSHQAAQEDLPADDRLFQFGFWKQHDRYQAHHPDKLKNIQKNLQG